MQLGAYWRQNENHHIRIFFWLRKDGVCLIVKETLGEYPNPDHPTLALQDFPTNDGKSLAERQAILTLFVWDQFVMLAAPELDREQQVEVLRKAVRSLGIFQEHEEIVLPELP